MVKINDDWFIFYHRHTNGTNYSRQGCFEKLIETEDGLFKQAEITSCCGVAPLKGEGEYPTYIACHVFSPFDITYIPWSGWMDDRFQKITQEGGDGDEIIGHVANMRPGTSVGYKYFDCKGIKSITIVTRGYINGFMEVRTSWDGEVIGKIPVETSNVWMNHTADVNVPDGVNALYFTFQGGGHLQFKSFILNR